MLHDHFYIARPVSAFALHFQEAVLPISSIRFSQDNINSSFSLLSPFRGRPLGEVLDKILLGHGRYLLVLLRDYKVTWRGGVWYTINNRTLWVFKQLLSRA